MHSALAAVRRIQWQENGMKKTLCSAFPLVRGSIRKCPRQDSNLRTRLRRPMLYPLSYGGMSLVCSATGETLPASAGCP